MYPKKYIYASFIILLIYIPNSISAIIDVFPTLGMPKDVNITKDNSLTLIKQNENPNVQTYRELIYQNNKKVVDSVNSNQTLGFKYEANSFVTLTQD